MDRSLYLAYRPQTFAEVVEQEHVCQTLSNAIKMDRLAHAYLFCGPRGTGKTSTARIFAKALNCEKGPTPTPCLECDNCRRIRDGYTMDVVELDAASNRGIDEIRELRKAVQYAPAEGKYKLYIIDEAHQITKDAFNALLKTLEEPPSYVVFVLATTEPDRLPATILSRCQRFDFKRLSNDKLAAHLMKVAAKEGVEIEEAAVWAIARAADGAARDGLTILEQMLSFSEKNITHEDVLSILGFTGTDALCSLTEAILDGEANKLLELVETLVDSGRDLQQLLKDLSRHFRDLLVLSVGAETAELKALGGELLETMKSLAQRLDRARAVNVIELLSAAQGELRWNSQHRLVVELALLKAAQPAPVATPIPAAPLAQQPRPPAARPAVTPPAPAPKPAPSPAPKPSRVAEAAASSHSAPPAEAPAAPAPAPPPPPPPQADPSAAAIAQRWPEVLAAIKKESVPVHALVVDSRPLALEGNRLVLGFHHQFHRDHSLQPDNQALIESVLAQTVGAFKIDGQLAAEWQPTESAESAETPAAQVGDGPSAPAVTPEQFIQQAVTKFDATILDQT